jgi:hypothetical protein
MIARIAKKTVACRIEGSFIDHQCVAGYFLDVHADSIAIVRPKSLMAESVSSLPPSSSRHRMAVFPLRWYPGDSLSGA